MTNDEIKRAMFDEVPVIYDGIEYERVAEIVYRRPANKIKVSAGLLDKNRNCLVYAPIEKIKAKEASP